MLRFYHRLLSYLFAPYNSIIDPYGIYLRKKCRYFLQSIVVLLEFAKCDILQIAKSGTFVLHNGHIHFYGLFLIPYGDARENAYTIAGILVQWGGRRVRVNEKIDLFCILQENGFGRSIHPIDKKRDFDG